MAKQIFIVDDDKQIRSLLGYIFELEGWAVEVASNFAEARELLASSKADCFVVDLKLPDGDGNELIQHIRSCQEAPILAISGESVQNHSFELVASRQSGADYYLNKPFEPDELIIECKRLMAIL